MRRNRPQLVVDTIMEDETSGPTTPRVVAFASPSLSHDASAFRTKHKSISSFLSPLIRAFVAGIAFTTILGVIVQSYKKRGCRISFGRFDGREYHSNMTVGRAQCLVESKFMRVQQHQVQMSPDSVVIADWLWIDYHDRINVLVQEADTGLFCIFEQTKYALENRVSWAIVGGIVEPHEEPKHAAQREVKEEMNLDCEQFQFLGRYTTDVNRGMGWLNSFYATGCKPIAAGKERLSDLTHQNEVGAADTERQDLKKVTLAVLKDAVRAGKFLEIQWTATISLAILHMESAKV